MATRRFMDRDGEEWEVWEAVVRVGERPPSSILGFRSVEGDAVYRTTSDRRVGELSEDDLQRALDRAKREL